MKNETYFVLLKLRQDLYNFTKQSQEQEIHINDIVYICNEYIRLSKPKCIDDYKRELGLSYANETEYGVTDFVKSV